MSASANSRLSSRLLALLYLEFALTGIATTLLGPLLPLFIRQCSMSDTAAGSLVAAQFAGQFVGSLFTNRHLRNSVVAGMPLITVGVAALGFSSCSFSYLCAASYGVGLGLTITATNLIIASQSERRAYSLILLNFLWGVGAVSSPILVEWARRHQLLPWSLLGFGVVTFGLWLAMICSSLSSPPQTAAGSGAPWDSPPLLFFGALFFLYVGVETSVGAWTAVYATRMPHVNEPAGASAVGCFWLALLSGRLINAALLRRATERLIYMFSLAIMLAGFSLFLLAKSSVHVLLAASVTGLGLAPLFPLLVSFASDTLLATRNSGWVFSSAGLGGAAVPWLTGQISARSGSLRAGFLLPASAAVIITIFSLAGLRKPTRSLKFFSIFPLGSGPEREYNDRHLNV